MHRLIAALAILTIVLAACSGGSDQTLTIYSGRGEDLVGELIAEFETQSGIEVEVRYADSAELAATILLEGDTSPADVFFAQDPASLGRVASAGIFQTLPIEVDVEPRFRSADNTWVGVSGRARTVVVNSDLVEEAEYPTSVWDLTDARWKGQLGIAPTNGSFLAFVAAMILTDGEAETLRWLEAIAANDPVDYPKNSPIVAATDRGEIQIGLVNHYYLLRLLAEQGDSPAVNVHLDGGPGALVMPSGVGVLASSDNVDAAADFIEFLLSEQAQRHFAEQTFEYPLAAGVAADPRLTPLDEINTPILDYNRLADALERATELVGEAGLI